MSVLLRSGTHVREQVVAIVIGHGRLLLRQVRGADQVLLVVVGKALTELLAVAEHVGEHGRLRVAGVVERHLQFGIRAWRRDGPAAELPAHMLAAKVAVFDFAPGTAVVEAVGNPGHAGVVPRRNREAVDPAAEHEHIALRTGNGNLLVEADVPCGGEAAQAHGIAAQRRGQIVPFGHDAVERACIHAGIGGPAHGEEPLGVGIGGICLRARKIAVRQQVDAARNAPAFQLRAGKPGRAAAGVDQLQARRRACPGNVDVRGHLHALPALGVRPAGGLRGGTGHGNALIRGLAHLQARKRPAASKAFPPSHRRKRYNRPSETPALPASKAFLPRPARLPPALLPARSPALLPPAPRGRFSPRACSGT